MGVEYSLLDIESKRSFYIGKWQEWQEPLHNLSSDFDHFISVTNLEYESVWSKLREIRPQAVRDLVAFLKSVQSCSKCGHRSVYLDADGNMEEDFEDMKEVGSIYLDDTICGAEDSSRSFECDLPKGKHEDGFHRKGVIAFWTDEQCYKENET